MCEAPPGVTAPKHCVSCLLLHRRRWRGGMLASAVPRYHAGRGGVPPPVPRCANNVRGAHTTCNAATANALQMPGPGSVFSDQDRDYLPPTVIEAEEPGRAAWPTALTAPHTPAAADAATATASATATTSAAMLRAAGGTKQTKHEDTSTSSQGAGVAAVGAAAASLATTGGGKSNQSNTLPGGELCFLISNSFAFFDFVCFFTRAPHVVRAAKQTAKQTAPTRPPLTIRWPALDRGGAGRGVRCHSDGAGRQQRHQVGAEEADEGKEGRAGCPWGRVGCRDGGAHRLPGPHTVWTQRHSPPRGAGHEFVGRAGVHGAHGARGRWRGLAPEGGQRPYPRTYPNHGRSRHERACAGAGAAGGRTHCRCWRGGRNHPAGGRRGGRQAVAAGQRLPTQRHERCVGERRGCVCMRCA